MYRIVYTNRMKKDAKLMRKRGKDMEKLTNVLSLLASGNPTLSGQGDTRFCTTDLRFCRVTVAQRTSSTLRSSALQNHKSEVQSSFGPQVPSFGGWQGNGMRRTGRTPIDVNAASRQKTVLGACVPLSTEGMPVRYRDHALIGSLYDFRECHIEPDWLLLYQIYEDTLILSATATGSHADLFGK